MNPEHVSSIVHARATTWLAFDYSVPRKLHTGLSTVGRMSAIYYAHPEGKKINITVTPPRVENEYGEEVPDPDGLTLEAQIQAVMDDTSLKLSLHLTLGEADLNADRVRDSFARQVRLARTCLPKRDAYVQPRYKHEGQLPQIVVGYHEGEQVEIHTLQWSIRELKTAAEQRKACSMVPVVDITFSGIRNYDVKRYFLGYDRNLALQGIRGVCIGNLDNARTPTYEELHIVETALHLMRAGLSRKPNSYAQTIPGDAIVGTSVEPANTKEDLTELPPFLALVSDTLRRAHPDQYALDSKAVDIPLPSIAVQQRKKTQGIYPYWSILDNITVHTRLDTTPRDLKVIFEG